MRSGDGEEDRIWGTKIKSVVVEVYEDEVTVVNREVRTESSEEMEREVKNSNTVHTSPAGSCAAEVETEPEIELFESAIKQICFIWDTVLDELEDEHELDAGYRLCFRNASLVISDERNKIDVKRLSTSKFGDRKFP